MSSERRPPDDQELEDFLAGRGRISEAYREAKRRESAPAELDAAILAAAREATRTNIVRRPRWLAPLALAATLALSVSVLMNIWRDPALRERAAAPPPAEKAEITAPAVAAEPAPAMMADAIEKKAEVMKPNEAARAKSTPPPPPALAPASEPVPEVDRNQALEARVMEESRADWSASPTRISALQCQHRRTRVLTPARRRKCSRKVCRPQLHLCAASRRGSKTFAHCVREVTSRLLTANYARFGSHIQITSCRMI